MVAAATATRTDLRAAGPGQAEPGKVCRGRQRWSRLLGRAERDPFSVLNDRRCLGPDFCEDFFYLCDGKVLEESPAVMDYASAAVDLAESTGDRHLMNRSLGVLVHAHIGREEWHEAEQVLKRYRRQAWRCCASCRSDYYRRRADLLLETNDVDGARRSLARSLREAGLRDPDVVARIRFLRGIAHYFVRERDRALDDAGMALCQLSLLAPNGYYLDTLGLIACFLHGGQPRHDAKVLNYLTSFRRRLKGMKKRTRVRTRLSWVEGLVYARLGDVRRAVDWLESARQALLKARRGREAVAVTADLAQLYCRTANDDNARAIQRLIATCLRELDLEAPLRHRLERVSAVLRSRPEEVFQELVALRSTVLVAVPGLLDRTFAGRRDAA